MSKYFNLRQGTQGTRFNWYRDGKDWKVILGSLVVNLYLCDFFFAFKKLFFYILSAICASYYLNLVCSSHFITTAQHLIHSAQETKILLLVFPLAQSERSSWMHSSELGIFRIKCLVFCRPKFNRLLFCFALTVMNSLHSFMLSQANEYTFRKKTVPSFAKI